MESINITESELKTMIADYMGRGFLDNIIDMFKHDKALYSFVGELMTDERVRVRLGMSALVETLKKEDPENIHSALPNILPLLNHKEPVIRGDAVYLLGIIGHEGSIPLLEKILACDSNKEVRLIAGEAIEDIKKNRT